MPPSSAISRIEAVARYYTSKKSPCGGRHDRAVATARHRRQPPSVMLAVEATAFASDSRLMRLACCRAALTGVKAKRARLTGDEAHSD